MYLPTNMYENVLPKTRKLFYNGQWHEPLSQRYFESINPATQESLGKVTNANSQDLNEAVSAAQQAFQLWKNIAPLERANYLRRAAHTLREHKEQIAMLDAMDGGNPFQFMQKDKEAEDHYLVIVSFHCEPFEIFHSKAKYTSTKNRASL